MNFKWKCKIVLFTFCCQLVSVQAAVQMYCCFLLIISSFDSAHTIFLFLYLCVFSFYIVVQNLYKVVCLKTVDATNRRQLKFRKA